MATNELRLKLDAVTYLNSLKGSQMSEAIVSDSKPCAFPAYPASGAATAYAFLRHTGFILDELSAQGLVLWLDNDNRWQWCWRETNLKSTQGFWAMGEALVDAVNGRLPETFSIPNK